MKITITKEYDVDGCYSCPYMENYYDPRGGNIRMCVHKDFPKESSKFVDSHVNKTTGKVYLPGCPIFKEKQC